VVPPLNGRQGAVNLRPWRLRFLALLLALVAWTAVGVFAPGMLRELDEQSTDLVWRASADAQTERRVVVVDVDDASVQRVGPWPWPRQTQARLVDALRERGATLQLYDMVFADAREGNDELAKALKATQASAPAVVGQVFALNGELQQGSGRLSGALPGQGCLPPAVPAHGYVANAEGLDVRAGHITPRIDPDGAVRRVPAIICFDNRNYPTLALSGILALTRDGKPARLQVEPGRSAWDPAWLLGVDGMPDIRLPLDVNGDLRVPYHKARRAIISVSAADILEGKPDATAAVKGAWALVGASAFGLSDTVPTPLGNSVSGLEVHAELLTGLLDQRVPSAPRASAVLQAIWAAAAIAILLTLSGLPRKTRDGVQRPGTAAVLWVPLASIGLAVAGFALHAAALLGVGWWVGWAPASLGVLLVGLCLGLADHARSLVEKGRLFRNLASYLPASVAEKIALSEPTGDIEAERRDLTVVAADVRNFSAYCEARSPEDAARVLHRFYTSASAIVEAHGGTVEEMVGDSLIAIFNGSTPCEDHPVKALLAAREIWLRCSEELPNVPPQGLEPLGLGVGVESGTALLGSFGPAARRVHSVLGQTVTVAMRLQDMTADLAYPVLVGTETASRIGVPFEQSDLALKPLGSFLLPGLRQASKVFTLRTLMLPGSDAEQQSLRYLRQQGQTAA